MSIEPIVLRYAPAVLSILRIIAALLFLEHGTSRLFAWPSPMRMSRPSIVCLGSAAPASGARCAKLALMPMRSSADGRKTSASTSKTV